MAGTSTKSTAAKKQILKSTRLTEYLDG